METDPALNTDLEELALDLSGPHRPEREREGRPGLAVREFPRPHARHRHLGGAGGGGPHRRGGPDVEREGLPVHPRRLGGGGLLRREVGLRPGGVLLNDCTAQKAADGAWTYEVGSQAIA